MARSTPQANRRMLLVHAHPDDESIGSGVTMARYAAEGAHVTLITCTRGEEGEVIPEDLGYLASDREDGLGEYRIGELAAAMAALGVRDHRFLDEVGYGFPPTHYRDSGMAYGPGREVIPLPDPRPDAFALADVEDAAARVAAVIRDVRPQVVITYEPGGGYGHPDHVQAHRVGMRGIDLAAEPGPGGPPWEVPKVYWGAIPERMMRAMVEAVSEREDNPFERWQEGPVPTMVVADELVTTGIDGREYFGAKEAAMRAHATQIAVDGPFFALTNNVGRPIMSMEFYRLVHGEPGGPRDTDGRETDLFGGLPDT